MPGTLGLYCGLVDARGNDAPVRCRSALDLWLGARGGMPAGRRELRHQAARRLEEALGTDGVLDFIG